jgi:hypothetical protein
MRFVDCVAYQLGFSRGEELVLVSLIAFVWTMISLDRLTAYLKGKDKKRKRDSTPYR